VVLRAKFWSMQLQSRALRNEGVTRSGRCEQFFCWNFAKLGQSGTVAQKQCKPYQTTEKRVVSLRNRPLFHKLINTYVENFISQKYFSRNSARLLLCEETCLLLTVELGSGQ